MSKKAKLAGTCIFCGAGQLSKEHFWPVWASELLPKYPGGHNVEQCATFTEKTKLVRSPAIRTRQGNLWTKKIRVVCRLCNNGWMSRLETMVKPILTPLISTIPHTITESSLFVLSQWIALKVLVGERNRPADAITTLEDCARFRQTLELPLNFKIWIARCGVQTWRTGYVRHSATMGTSPILTPQCRLKNIHSVAFGVGDLFVFVIHTTDTTVADKITFGQSGAVLSLVPTNGVVTWPPTINLSGNSADAIAGTLDQIINSQKVQWAPNLSY